MQHMRQEFFLPRNGGVHSIMELKLRVLECNIIPAAGLCSVATRDHWIDGHESEEFEV